MDGEGDLLLGALERRQGEGVDLGVAGPEVLHGAVERGVDVGAVAAHHEHAEIAVAGLDRRLERGFALVGVRDRNRPGRVQDRIGGVFGDVVDGRRSDHGRIVDAVDGERDLLGGAVERGDREGVDLGVAGAEILRGRI